MIYYASCVSSSPLVYMLISPWTRQFEDEGVLLLNIDTSHITLLKHMD